MLNEKQLIYEGVYGTNALRYSNQYTSVKWLYVQAFLYMACSQPSFTFSGHKNKTNCVIDKL